MTRHQEVDHVNLLVVVAVILAEVNSVVNGCLNGCLKDFAAIVAAIGRLVVHLIGPCNTKLWCKYAVGVVIIVIPHAAREHSVGIRASVLVGVAIVAHIVEHVQVEILRIAAGKMHIGVVDEDDETLEVLVVVRYLLGRSVGEFFGCSGFGRLALVNDALAHSLQELAFLDAAVVGVMGHHAARCHGAIALHGIDIVARLVLNQRVTVLRGDVVIELVTVAKQGEHRAIGLGDSHRVGVCWHSVHPNQGCHQGQCHQNLFHFLSL